MNKPVPFTGYTTNPSDRQCPDGDLSLCYNAINEDGALRPILRPKTIATISDGYAPVFIHQTTINSKVIAEKDGHLYWCEMGENIAFGADRHIGDFAGYRDIKAMGSILVIAMEDGLRYVCWKEDRYVVLGSKPPRIEVEVGTYTFIRSSLELENDNETLCDLTEYITDSQFDSATAYPGYSVPVKEEDKPDICNLLLGAINKLSAKITSEGLFPYPFFIRFAYRLFDGTHTMVTAPQLIIPTSTGKPIFLVQRVDADHRKGIAVLPATQLTLTFGEIDHAWDDYITHIDILVSPLIYGYTPDNKGFDGFGALSKEDEEAFTSAILGNNIHSYSPQSPILDAFLTSVVQKVTNKSVGTSTFPVTINGTVVYRGLVQNIRFDTLGARFVYGKTRGNRDSFKLCWPLTGTDINDGTENEVTEAIITTAEAKAAGLLDIDDDYKVYDLTHITTAYTNLDIVAVPHAHRNPKVEYSYTVPTRPYDGEYMAAHFKRSDDTTIEEQICRSGVFHVLKSIPVEKIVPGQVTYLELKEADIANIPVKETVTEDFRSSDIIVADNLFPYNSRLTASVEKVVPTDGGSPYTLFSSPYYDFDTKVKKIWVELNDNGNKVVVTQDVPHDDFSGFDLKASMWIYYPSLNARYIGFVMVDDTMGRIPLKRHDFLNGSYFFNGFSTLKDALEPVSEIPQGYEYIAVGNQICNSEVGNPFHFPLQGWSAVGNGRILGLSSAVEALSQGQFGQFPLYAFTTEGVWVLSVSSEGTYTACQPVTRESCLSVKAIAQLESSVVFPSEKGLMRLSGSSSECLSDYINEYVPFDVSRLPGISPLFELSEIGRDTDFSVSFREYIRDCCILYDHIRRLLYVTNNAFPYSYALSLKSMRWGMCRKEASYALNNYPSLYGVARITSEDTDIFMDVIKDYSDTDNDTREFLAVSRPMKLDAADVLKTVDGVYLRGYIPKRNRPVMALWGSRDLEHWNRVSASSAGYLEGMRGDGYKYFRVAVQGNMYLNNYLTGVDMEFRPRQTNRIR